MKKRIFFTICLILAIFSCFAISEKFVSYAQDIDTAITITGYDVVATVDLTNTVSLREEIDVNFLRTRSVFVRSLPLYSIVTRNINGTVKQMRYNLSYDNITIKNGSNLSLDFEEVEENGYLFLDIGYDGSLMYPSGTTKTFVISYSVSLGNDRISQFDEFYYNIIGTDWACGISNINWTINFPKEVNNNLYVYVGANGETNIPSETLTVINKTLSGSYSSLEAFNGITLKAQLEEGYFSLVPRPDLLAYVVLAIIALIILICIIVKAKTDTKFVVTPVVEFSAPKGMNPCEAGYLLDGHVDSEDIASFIVYWANKGYLSIKEEDNKTWLTKNTEVKEYDFKSYEKPLFNAIFTSGDTVELGSLDYTLSIPVERIKMTLPAQKSGEYFSKKSISSQLLILFLGALSVACSVGYASLMLNTGFTLVSLILIFILSFFTSTFALLSSNYEYTSRKKLFSMISISIFVLQLISVIVSCILFNGETFGNPILLVLFGEATFFVCLYLGTSLSTRLDKSSKELGSLLGLKHFIEVAEKDRLEMLVKENPQAFFEVLPFAYTLDVSDIWIKKFEKIAISNPAWFSSDRGLNTYLAISAISRMNTHMKIATFARPQNSSGSGTFGGGGFGGGFSGGGFGGGGGHSR
ncbi:MAG: DUF2207 domain-containing protein [Clostridia bacterium]